MSYTIQIEKAALKQLAQLPLIIVEAIDARVSALQTNPRPPGCKKLKGRDGWRIRIGDYRVIYKIDDNVLIILVIDIGHRKNIYNKK